MVGPSRATPLPAAPRPTPDSLDGARAVSRETAGTTNGVPYRPRAGECQRGLSGCHCTAPSGPNGIGRERASGAPVSAGTAVRRGDVRAADPETSAPTESVRPSAPVNGIQAPAGAGSRMAPSAYPQNSAQPRAVPRDNPAYRPMPAPPDYGGGGSSVRTPAPSSPGGDTRARDGAARYGRAGSRHASSRAQGLKEVAPSRAPNPGKHQGQRQRAAGSVPLRQRSRPLAAPSGGAPADHRQAEAHRQAEPRPLGGAGALKAKQGPGARVPSGPVQVPRCHRAGCRSGSASPQRTRGWRNGTAIRDAGCGAGAQSAD